MKINKTIMNGYTLYHIPSQKFKVFAVGGFFFRPFNKDKIVENILLSNILMKYNQKYPTEQLFSKYLEERYGMSCYCSSNRWGMTSVMSFTIRSINDRYLTTPEYDLLHETVEVLNDMINLPIFDEKLFNFEKQLLIEDIERAYDHKTQYAQIKFIQTMFVDESYRYNVVTSLEHAKDVTLDDIKAEYLELLKAQKIFFAKGDLEKNKVINEFKELKFSASSITDLVYLDYETKEIKEVTEVIEKQNYKQSIVIMGYRVDIRKNDDDFFPMILLDGMLGNFFHSTLFQEIREKRSLAYNISSEYNGTKGVFVISAGISGTKFREFKEVVSQIISDYQKGLIDDQTMALTKKMLINARYHKEDQISFGISEILADVTKQPYYPLLEYVEKITNITKDDLMKAAKKLKLDTIYLLEGVL